MISVFWESNQSNHKKTFILQLIPSHQLQYSPPGDCSISKIAFTNSSFSKIFFYYPLLNHECLVDLVVWPVLSHNVQQRPENSDATHTTSSNTSLAWIQFMLFLLFVYTLMICAQWCSEWVRSGPLAVSSWRHRLHPCTGILGVDVIILDSVSFWTQNGLHQFNAIYIGPLNVFDFKTMNLTMNKSYKFNL